MDFHTILIRKVDEDRRFLAAPLPAEAGRDDYLGMFEPVIDTHDVRRRLRNPLNWKHGSDGLKFNPAHFKSGEDAKPLWDEARRVFFLETLTNYLNPTWRNNYDQPLRAEVRPIPGKSYYDNATGTTVTVPNDAGPVQDSFKQGIVDSVIEAVANVAHIDALISMAMRIGQGRDFMLREVYEDGVYDDDEKCVVNSHYRYEIVDLYTEGIPDRTFGTDFYNLFSLHEVEREKIRYAAWYAIQRKAAVFANNMRHLLDAEDARVDSAKNWAVSTMELLRNLSEDDQLLIHAYGAVNHQWCLGFDAVSNKLNEADAFDMENGDWEDIAGTGFSGPDDYTVEEAVNDAIRALENNGVHSVSHAEMETLVREDLDANEFIEEDKEFLMGLHNDVQNIDEGLKKIADKLESLRGSRSDDTRLRRLSILLGKEYDGGSLNQTLKVWASGQPTSVIG